MIGILFWAVAAVAFAVIEGVTTALVSLWFVGGSLAALIAVLLGAQLWLQVVLFFVVSVLLFLVLRPVLHKSGKTRTNTDSNLGKTAVVTEEIDNVAGRGHIRIDGVDWSARSADGCPIAAGTLVTVRSISGVKATVEPQSAAQLETPV